MNRLLSTTALVVALGFPTLMLAQMSEPVTGESAAATETKMDQPGAGTSGFLTQRSEADLFASELIGHDVYARRADGDAGTNDDQTIGTTDDAQGMPILNRADLDQMDNIGEINEIVLSADGDVRAIIVGAGGFLGMGEHDVAVTMDQISFLSDVDEPTEFHIVVNTGADALKNAPAFEREPSTTDAATGGGDTDRSTVGTDTAESNAALRTDDRAAFPAPDMTRDGYTRVDAKDVSTEMLMGTTVYDTSDNDVGSVMDMLLDADGKITNVIIDFGGFLGIGSSQASLEFGELTILTDEGYDDVRIYVDASREQIQALPRYMASN